MELHRALEGENVKVVRDLLSRKADPNAPSARGQSPLEMTAEKDSLALCRLLLVYQADPESLVSSDGLPAKSETVELVRSWGQGDVPTVFGALEECVIDAASAHDVSLLGLALASMDIAGGDAEQVAALLDERQNTLLHLCAQGTGQSQLATAEAAARLTARLLLGWGVPVDGRNDKDETALLFAMRAMHSKVRGRAGGASTVVPAEPARALLEARADVETVDPMTRETLLMQAAKEGDLTACRLLLECRADPLRPNLQGQNAINLCAHRPEVAMLLRSSLVRRNGEAESLQDDPQAQQLQNSPIGREDSFSTPLPKEVSMSSEVEIIKMDGNDLDQEEAGSIQGILNQVDLEESYESIDWGNVEINIEKHADGDWDHVRPVAA